MTGDKLSANEVAGALYILNYELKDHGRPFLVNYCAASEFSQLSFTRRNNAVGDFVIIFSGSAAKCRNMKEMVEAYSAKYFPGRFRPDAVEGSSQEQESLFHLYLGIMKDESPSEKV